MKWMQLKELNTSICNIYNNMKKYLRSIAD